MMVDTELKKKDFARFNSALECAVLAIDQFYFLVPRANSKSVYRERVYCYELYHQLKLQLKKMKFSSEYSLNGELDKVGTKSLKGKKPDFIFHQPGDDYHNLLTMEVKSSRYDVASFCDDIRKLKFFQKEKDYFGGIMLIYGDVDVHVQQEIRGTLTNNILCYIHGFPGNKPEKI